MLFADDMVLLSDTPMGLQKQIDALNSACKDLSLTVNTDKTKVMVFRKGGFLRRNESWNLDGNALEIVNDYSYLGFTFTTRMSISRGVDTLAAKGKKACADCVRYISKLNEISKECFFKIFDTQVQPVIMYASEVWGLHRLDSIERVHTYACKRLLNVTSKLPNKFVYGETGRYPLYVNSAVRCIRYWLKILKMDMSRIPKQAYEMLLRMDNSGKECWASQVRLTLFSLGFGDVWLHQGVGDERVFMIRLRQRMIDIFQQEWSASIESKEMYQYYRQFKSVFSTEMYFDHMNIKHFRDCLVKLRLGLLPLKGAAFKSVFSVIGADRSCYCGEVEDEMHFVCSCPLYKNIRERYLSPICIGPMSYYFFDFLKCTEEKVSRSLGMFVSYALRSREIIMDT